MTLFGGELQPILQYPNYVLPRLPIPWSLSGRISSLEFAAGAVFLGIKAAIMRNGPGAWPLEVGMGSLRRSRIWSSWAFQRLWEGDMMPLQMPSIGQPTPTAYHV